MENQWWDFVSAFDELKTNTFDGGPIDSLWVDHLKQSHGQWDDQVVPQTWAVQARIRIRWSRSSGFEIWILVDGGIPLQ